MATKEVTSSDELVLNAIFNPHTPFQVENEPVDGSSDDSDIDVPAELKQLEIDAVNSAQKGDVNESLNLFNQLIEKAPEYASGYNNRAQLLRLKGDNECALNDLNKAIELSNGHGLAASQAFVQRGLLSKLNKDTENAMQDFGKAAKLGNVFAKQQLTEMNPYAALCNKMLAKTFAKEFNPEVVQ